jgi:D-sedoheptulose 7-phosphate isomerase
MPQQGSSSALSLPPGQTAEEWFQIMQRAHPAVASIYGDVMANAGLAPIAAEVAQAFTVISECWVRGGTLYLCGNGGSLADALHISGEMLKAFARPRPLPEALKARLAALPLGGELASHLQAGLRAHVLGANAALASAVANDIPVAGIGYAQELCALAKAGDVLLGISTSGRARNVLLAATAARALDIATIGLTGQAPNPLASMVDIALAVPERETYRVQELHLALYHRLCLMLEARFF